MRKQLYILCLLSLFASRMTLAADSTITITGNVKDNACSVSSGSQNFVVDLMSHSVKQLYSVGAVTPMVPFNIVFDKCGGSSIAVKVGFTGGADGDNTSLLQVDGGNGAAAGMGIQLLDNNRNAVALNAGTSALDWSTLTGGQSNTLYFYARLMATKPVITAGLVRATANFILEFQ